MLCWKILTKSLQGWNSTKWSEHSRATTVDKLELHNNNLLQKRGRRPWSKWVQGSDSNLQTELARQIMSSLHTQMGPLLLFIIGEKLRKNTKILSLLLLPASPPLPQRKIIQYRIPRMPFMAISLWGWSSPHGRFCALSKCYSFTLAMFSEFQSEE